MKQVIERANKYCDRFCEYHPKIAGDKGIGYYPYACCSNGKRILLKEEYSKGRPLLKHRNCPLNMRLGVQVL